MGVTCTDTAFSDEQQEKCIEDLLQVIVCACTGHAANATSTIAGGVAFLLTRASCCRTLCCGSATLTREYCHSSSATGSVGLY